MFRRTNRKNGTKFWGCWNYPQCTGTVNISRYQQRDLFPIPAWMCMEEEENPYPSEYDTTTWDDLQMAVED